MAFNLKNYHFSTGELNGKRVVFAHFFFLFYSFHDCILVACVQRPGGLAKLGIDYTPFGLSLTVKGRAEVRTITLTPNFAKPFIGCRCFFNHSVVVLYNQQLLALLAFLLVVQSNHIDQQD